MLGRFPRVPRLPRVAVAVLAAFVVALGPATHAWAVPSPEEIERQIDAQWQVLEPVIEQYNGVNADLKANRAKADALQKQLEPLQAQVDQAMSKVEGIAVQAYKGGRMSAVNAILTGTSPAQLGEHLGRLEAVARQQRLQISDVAAVRDQYANDKKALDQLIAKQAAQEAELAGKKKEIEKQIADLQKLRTQSYGTSTVASGDLKPVACPVEYGPGAAATATRTACAQIGKMYQYGAEGPNNFDCSGLTLYSWKSAGKSLPRTAAQQYSGTARVSRAELLPGDLIFFYKGISHVGIYVGGGWMVHASRAGEPIRMRDLSKYNTAQIVGYGRVR